MAVPPFEEFYRPVLEITAGPKAPLTRKEVTVSVTERFSLTESDQRETIPSGMKTRVRDRVDWALTDLKQAGLLSTPRHNRWQITSQGEVFLNDHPGDITRAEVRDLAKKPDLGPEPVISGVESSGELTPGEQIAQGYQQLQFTLSMEILDSLENLEPYAFEQLVVELLERMGYGDGSPTQRSRDRGIDGVLKQDPLGLEKIYVQAKRWNTSQVTEKVIREFHSSLVAKGATKGVVVTNSTFTDSAKSVAENFTAQGKPISLIDGSELVQLMIRHGLGVVTEITYEVKKLDANYFAEV